MGKPSDIVTGEIAYDDVRNLLRAMPTESVHCVSGG